MATKPLSLLGRLPIEVVSIICSLLPVCNIADFRLASKDCARIGERHLVRELHLMFHPKSFQNLLQISLHPALSKHVKSIFYECNVLIDIDQGIYESYVSGLDVAELLQDVHKETRQFILKGWAAYKPLLEMQKYMMRTQHDVCILSQTFPRFPVLKNLHISSDVERFDRGPTPFQQVFRESLAVEKMLFAHGQMEDVRALGSVLLAGSSPEMKVESLTAHSFPWSIFDPSPTELNFHRPVFTHLRHLDLTLVPDDFGEDEEENVTANHIQFGKALSTATGLQTLRLIVGDHGLDAASVAMRREKEVPVMWSNIFQGMTWENLQFLSLHGVTVSEECIIDFVRNYSRNLRILKLTSMWLTETERGWGNVFYDMIANMRLAAVRIKGIWGWEDKNRAPYLLDMQRSLGRYFEKMVMSSGEIEDYVSNSEDEEFSWEWDLADGVISLEDE